MRRWALTNIEVVDVTGSAMEGSGISEELLRRSVLTVLETSVLCSMATVTPDGRAHASTAYFSFSDALDLYFLSHPGSLHCRNLTGNPSAAVTVFSSEQAWAGPDRGLQLFGTCGQAAGSWAHEAERSYRARFPAYDGWKDGLAEGDLAREYRFHRFEVMAVKALDEKDLGDGVFVRAQVRRW